MNERKKMQRKEKKIRAQHFESEISKKKKETDQEDSTDNQLHTYTYK